MPPHAYIELLKALPTSRSIGLPLAQSFRTGCGFTSTPSPGVRSSKGGQGGLGTRTTPVLTASGFVLESHFSFAE